MKANLIIVAVVVMMGLAAAHTDDPSDPVDPINPTDLTEPTDPISDKNCTAAFKDFLGKNFQMPADVAAFIELVEVDFEQLWKDDEIGEDIFKAAAEDHGRPDEGCEIVKKVAQEASEPFKCMESLQQDAIHDLLFGDKQISEYWRANTACEASEPSKLLDDEDV